jgi:hypothetical protein
MAAADLKTFPGTRQSLRAWASAYALIWAATISGGLGVTVGGSQCRQTVRGVLGLALNARGNAPPDAAHVIGLWAHNVPIAAWPILLGWFDADHGPIRRRSADAAVAVCALASALPVGAAFAAYGPQLIPYIPHLPLEWGGLAAGCSGWLAQRQHPQSAKAQLARLAVTMLLLLGAAVLETVAVPHR